MSSSMNAEKAHEIAKQMTYRDAVINALRGRCVPFKKATAIKLKELLDVVETLDNAGLLEKVPITDEMIQSTKTFTLEELIHRGKINGK